MGKSLSHEIRKHILCRTIFHIDHSLFDVIPDKVELNIDMFCLPVMCGILRKWNHALIVAEDDCQCIFWHSDPAEGTGAKSILLLLVPSLHIPIRPSIEQWLFASSLANQRRHWQGEKGIRKSIFCHHLPQNLHRNKLGLTWWSPLCFKKFNSGGAYLIRNRQLWR